MSSELSDNIQNVKMSLCFGDAFRQKRSGEITEQTYIESLMAHFRGVRHPTDHPDDVNEMIFVWTNDIFGDATRDIALKTEYKPLNDTSLLEKHFCSCLNDDLETFTSTLEQIRTQHPSLNFLQLSTILAAYHQQPHIFKYCLGLGASLDPSVQKAITTSHPLIIPFSSIEARKWGVPAMIPTDLRQWSLPFLEALYSINWERIRSSRKALGIRLSFRASPEVIIWLFDHGAEIGPDFFAHMSNFAVPAATVQLLLERTSIAFFRSSGVLERAAGRGETDVVRILLDAGADINAGPFGGDEREAGAGPALLEAVKGQHVETARLLLERGADMRRIYSWHPFRQPKTSVEMEELLSLYRETNGGLVIT